MSLEVARQFETQGSAQFAKTYSLGASRVQFQNKDPRGWREFADLLGRHSAVGAANTMRGVQARRPSIYDLESRLRAMNVPTLIVVGDEDDHCLQPGIFMKKTIPASGLLVLPKTGHTRQLMDRLFRPYRDELKVRMELPSVGMIKRFVAAGLGVSLISASFAEDYVQAHRARLVPIRDVELWRELGLVYPNNRTLPRPVTSFIATVRQLTRPSSHSAAAGT